MARRARDSRSSRTGSPWFHASITAATDACIAAGTALLLATSGAVAQHADWSGHVSMEPRVFLDAALFPEQGDSRSSWSAVLAPEFRYEWHDGRDRVTIAPYLRIDEHDDERDHADLREAAWQHIDGPWALLIGVSKVFWGVTESRHLVDIVNQTDQVEDLDGEDKLGQPMVQLERSTSAGTFGLFVLPYFRERTFPAEDGRLRGALPIVADRPEYESRARQRRVDFAARWANTLGSWDLGAAIFHGTSREPRLVPTPITATSHALVPHYDLVTQLGVDVQYTRKAWLWKLETLHRSGRHNGLAAAVGGFEYTLFGLGGRAADLGVLLEYLYDGRDAQAPPTVYDDAAFVGARLALNDPDGTAVLIGALLQRDGGGAFGVLEAERRIGEAWKLELEARLFSGIDAADPVLGGLRNDSFLTLRASRFF